MFNTLNPPNTAVTQVTLAPFTSGIILNAQGVRVAAPGGSFRATRG